MIRPFRPEVCFPETLEVFDELVEFRHDLHQHPELAFETARTCEKIAEKLRAWGVDEIDTTTVPGAVIAVVKGNRPGKTVALRGDIDAPPMPDRAPQITQARYFTPTTGMPSVPAACGCSPTAL